jgi:hypothetical protein
MPHRRSHFAVANRREMVSFETTAQLLENLWVNGLGNPFAGWRSNRIDPRIDDPGALLQVVATDNENDIRLRQSGLPPGAALWRRKRKARLLSEAAPR